MEGLPMFDLTLCYIARLKYSEFYDRPFYSTTLTLNFTDENLNERLVMNDPEHPQDTDTPPARLYFGKGQEDFQNADDYAYIIADPKHTGSRILPIELFKQAELKMNQPAKDKKVPAQA